MSKAVILIGTFLVSVAITVWLVMLLPGHFNMDETKTVSSSENLDWTKSWDYPDQTLGSLIAENLGHSILLQIFSFLLVLFLSFGLSLLALRVAWILKPLRKMLVVGISAPSLFWIPLLVYFFSLKLEIFPLRYEPTILGWILPLFALMLRPLCGSTEILLNEWKRAETQNYFLVARSKGLSRTQVFYRHGLKNALIPYTTQMGSFLVQSLMGSVLVETLFSFPGIGYLFVQSLQSRDLPVVLALTIIYSFISLLIHALVELLQFKLEPRADRAHA